MKLSSKISENVSAVKKIITSDDVQFVEIKTKAVYYEIIFLKDTADKKGIGELIMKPLAQLKGKVSHDMISDAVNSPERKEVYKTEDVAQEIADGSVVLIIDGENKAYSFGIKKFEKRAIAEPPTSTVIKGPREGFVESLPVNVSLMRRKIKSPDLTFLSLTVGDLSHTPVYLCYIKGLASEDLIKKLKKKIENIKIDAVLDSSYVAKYLGEHETSIFKQVGNTEKPDILSAKILEGRVAIFVDGSPIALTVPYILMEDFQSPSDYYASPYSATFSRIIRLISVAISLLLPALFVSAELFHLQLIPLAFLLTIENSIKGIPLSPSYEMFFTLLIFEILNEASVRMPKYVGMVVSIVGGLVLGETAVNAGIISAPTLMIVALSGICLYTVPELEQIFSVIRLVFLAVAGAVGSYGLLVAVMILLVYLITFENYSTPVLAPYSPLIPKDVKDGFIKVYEKGKKNKPLSFKKT